MASVKVAVRVRPFNQRERGMNAKQIIKVEGKKTRILNHKVAQGKEGDLGRERYKDFTFDHSYWSFDECDPGFASQEQVFEDLGTDVVDSAFQGYNACVFAYGQTGSGKTFTMMGSPECQGLIPRICKAMFARMSAGKEQGASYRTEVSYLEIYNERVKDLLQPGLLVNHSLRVREHPVCGPYVQDLSHHLVTDYEHIHEVMLQGNMQRTTASTNMNDVSSRSHAIFTITFAQAGFNMEMMPSETISKVHLVDLAGSERADTSGATGQRLKEGGHINKSLVTLGSVISALAELSSNSSSRKSVFIPYRDSVLTWLLKDSLGGNSKTIMIAAISPADCNYGETLSTLRYANRAKNIINKPTINEDPNVKLIRDLREEISKLKSLLGDEFTQVLQQELHQKQAQEKVLTEEWAEKWRETQQILQEQTALGLRKAGAGVVLDSDMPHLVGMVDDDLLSTGVTLYHLKDGETLIGTDNATKPQDIILNGSEAESHHCSVVLRNGVATLIPQPFAQCWVNSAQVDKPTKLSQGCIIVLGTNVFRYNDPVEAAKMRKEGSRSHLNLSRLSLLSWSTPDLALSSENIYSFSEDPEELEELQSERATLLLEKESFKREQAEKQLDWERQQLKRRESLEMAQKELDTERQKMEEEYAMQCRRLAQDWCRLEKHQQDSLATLKERRAELNQHLTALQSEQSKEKDEIEDECRQVAALKVQLDLKRKQFMEFVKTVAKHGGTQRTSEYAPLASTVKSLQSLAAEKYLSETQSQASDSSSESYVSLTHEPDVLREVIHNQRQECINMEAKLRSLELSVVEKSCILSKLETALADVADSIQAGTHEMNVMREALAKRTEQQLLELSQKKQALSLDLKKTTAFTKLECDGSSEEVPSPARASYTMSSSVGTADTFHTADSLCMEEKTKPNSCDTIQKLSVEIASNVDYHSSDGTEVISVEKNCGNMESDESDASNTGTEDCCKMVDKVSSLATQNCITPRRTKSHHSKYSRSLLKTIRTDLNGLSASQAMRAMKRLCQRVSQQKMLIMQSLENDCGKAELNSQIVVLQDLQRQYVGLEVFLGQHPLHPLSLDNAGSSEDSDDVSTSADDGLSELLVDDKSLKLDNNEYHETSSSAEGQLSPMSEISAFTVLSSQGTDRTSSPSECQELVSLPSYVLRGTGGQTHYEYEVRVVCSNGENWSLLRRYKRFRELHLTMQLRYGTPIEALSFPPRVFFSRNSESLARRRRNDLELYLRQLLDICSTLPSCPLYSCRGSLTKLSILEFSAFFRKGIFETGKYSTS